LGHFLIVDLIEIEKDSPGTDVILFKNIFAEKFVFDPKQSLIMQKFDHNIGF
jgi:hypothetical protein